MTDYRQKDIAPSPARTDAAAVTARTRDGASGRRLGVKVPEITVWFWVAKVLTTGVGETTSDFLVHRMDPALALGLGVVGLVVSLVLQFAVRRYVPWVYWLCVVLVSVCGTMGADAVHVVLGVPYALSAAFFVVVLSAVFVLWFRAEGTLSIHSVNARRRELFYWAAVLSTFALGTAVGDMTAYSLSLGYLSSGALFAGAIAVAGALYRRGWLPAIPAFWCAYILTRPLGASFADWAAVSPERGGLAWGTGPVSLALLACIAALVAFLSTKGGTGSTAGLPRGRR